MAVDAVACSQQLTGTIHCWADDPTRPAVFRKGEGGLPGRGGSQGHLDSSKLYFNYTVPATAWPQRPAAQRTKHIISIVYCRQLRDCNDLQRTDTMFPLCRTFHYPGPATHGGHRVAPEHSRHVQTHGRICGDHGHNSSWRARHVKGGLQPGVSWCRGQIGCLQCRTVVGVGGRGHSTMEPAAQCM